MAAAKKAKSKGAKKEPVRKAARATEPAASAPKPRRGKAAVDLAAALAQTLATNERLNQYLLEQLDARVWDLPAPIGKGRRIRSIVAHVHNVRLLWLAKAVAPTAAPSKVSRDTLTLEQARQALAESAAALDELLRRALAAGGHLADFKPDVVGFVGYLIAHEAHHRGQICLLARMLGHPLSHSASFGLWEWRRRSDEVGAGEA